MIAKAIPERGTRAVGLVKYLFGPGRFNEHTNPRVVAAWDSTFVRASDEQTLDDFEQALLGREMEAPLRLHGIAPGKHVYHVPVSIEAESGALSDEQWQRVALEAADELGFTETQDRAAVPWIAVRHGLSEKGNDHIHFVAVLVRESGEKVDIWNDWKKWETVRHAAEDRWGLRSTRRRGGGLPGLTRGEIERAKREGRDEPERVELARIIRSTAGAARSESEFVHRLRRAGVLVRPRWKTGGQEEVVGYSVALRVEDGSRKPIWFGGGKLAGDLNLTGLRERWGEPDELSMADALRAWRPRGWRDLPTGRQLQRTRLRAEAWEIAGAKTAEVRALLARISPQDRAAWSAVANEAAGAIGALANRVDVQHRPQLRAAARSLARAAQIDRDVPRLPPIPEVSPLVGVIRTATDAFIAGNGGAYAVASLVMQIGRLVQVVQQAHEAAGRAAEAQRAAAAAQQMLDFVRRSPRQAESAEQREDRERERHTGQFGEATRTTSETKENDHGRER